MRAQCIVKLADENVFLLNQLMGFSFAWSSSWNKGPYANLRTKLWKIKRTFAQSLWRTFIFSQVENNSLLAGSNSTWYLLLSNGCNSSITFLGNSTPPWYVRINNSMHCVCRICFLSTDQMHNKALWTSFLFKHGSWCV